MARHGDPIGANQTKTQQGPLMRSRNLLLILLPMATIVGCTPEQPELDDADEHFLAAKDAIANGDQTLAIAELTTSIELREDAWAYFERAQVYASQGDDDKANADIQHGLAIDPNSTRLKWLKRELTRPKSERFTKEPRAADSSK